MLLSQHGGDLNKRVQGDGAGEMRQVRFREDRSRPGYLPAFPNICTHRTPLGPSDDLYIHSFVRNLSPGSSNLHFKMAFPFSAPGLPHVQHTRQGCPVSLALGGEGLR